MIEYTDRYKALGIPYPDPKTVCKGLCEGTGIIPVHCPSPTDKYWILWNEAHIKAGEHECDGYHFVKCPDCKGTGKQTV